MLSAHTHPILDVLAWIPYGLTHFAAPFACALLLFACGPPRLAPLFARAFGYMNLLGVLTQLALPCSPPWYEREFGLAPAHYGMDGSPAGLARIDRLTGLDLYTSSFTASPMVFGAFPSLHAASATLEALFMGLVFPRLAPLFALYAAWLCWATMYLSHHYAVDLVGGALLAGIVFYVAKTHFLPRVQPNKLLRWDYEVVEFGEDALEGVDGAMYDALSGAGAEGKGDEESLPLREFSIGDGEEVISPTSEDERRFSSDADTLSTSPRGRSPREAVLRRSQEKV